MKKLIILSVAVSFALSGNVVNDLDIDQINKVNNNSNFSGGATVSQGQTDIQNDSTVTDLSIVQKDGIDAGNLIDNVTITGTNQLHQGLTSIDNSRVEHTDLNSKNEVKNVSITGSTSVVTQGALFIGGESNVTGTGGNGGNGTGFPCGGASGENIEITEINKLSNTNIDNSTLHQGLTTINNQASVTNTFKLKQQNTIDYLNGTNSENNSIITQGHTAISGGTTSDIEQNIQNNINNITVDGTKVKQSTINLTDSIVSNINNANNVDIIDEKNRIDMLTGIGTSSVNQSSIDINASSVDNLNRVDRPSGTSPEAQNNWICNVTVNNSNINQSSFTAKNGSDIKNMTYTLNSAINSAAVNNLYNSTINNSTLNQDTTELDNATVDGSNNISRLNIVQEVTAINGSDISQNKLKIVNSTANNLNLTEYNRLGGYGTGVSMSNANITQGSTTITD